MKRRGPLTSFLLLTLTLTLPSVCGGTLLVAADDPPAANNVRAIQQRLIKAATVPVEPPETAAPEVDVPAATHEQTSTIQTMHNGAPIRLNTFTLDAAGQILACVGTPTAGEGATGYLQVYSPTGELVRETELEFVPTAVTAMPDGTAVTAGIGQLSRISAAGKVLVTIDSPHVGDLDSLTDRLAVEAEEQMKSVTKRYADMIEGVKERLAAIEEKAADDRTDRDELMLKSLPRQLEMYQQTAERMEQTYSRIYSPEALLKRKLGITSLAATSRDLFVTTNSIAGRGYEIWRLDHELSAPKQIMTGLGGCCGQCDVQAAGENIIIGENTKFQVAVVDRDGQRLSSFGKRDRSSVDGFGSCCNPMNVTCCRNGDIITSESTVGNIKRFSADGEYLGLVGKASISGGCKHVAVSFDEQRNRYYTMNIDKGHICVLEQQQTDATDPASAEPTDAPAGGATEAVEEVSQATDANTDGKRVSVRVSIDTP